ncbi:MAG: nicotinate phosphoribosyltransferase [Clostridia bacterium]|nr:nicotinate phosphoribosyltransferase [Clostridia bacterium]
MNGRTNYTMLLDFYELTMAQGYFLSGQKDKIAYFDVFFRDIPDNGGFAIAAGLEDVIRYVKDLEFTDADIEYLRGKKLFCEEFLAYLKTFRFTGDIYAVPEGTPIFPREPIMIVRAPTIEAQIIETFILLTLNHQSLIATKANRIVRAADGRAVMEFGARRAQGAAAAINGARAAYIAGCASTSNAIADRDYHVNASGTMAHAWVQMFDNEYDAFAAYCHTYPTCATLLIDTYNVMKSGLPNAIRAFKEILIPQGIHNFGVRLDSGDIAYLTKKIRKKLDEEGLPECKIVVSNSLDEYIIRDLLRQGAQIDSFGVGERLITAKSQPVFGGVYKLVATEENGEITPKIKISENPEKITNPHFKKLYRVYDKDSNEAIADLLCIHDEVMDESQPLEIFHPQHVWKRKTLTNYYLREMLVPIFKDGECVYDSLSTEQIRAYCADQVAHLWDEVKRFENPHIYYVDLSQKLWDLKQNMLREGQKN